MSGEIGRVDTHGAAEPVERNPPFGDETPDVADAHADALRSVLDGQQLGGQGS
jgi:hypothetical protein